MAIVQMLVSFVVVLGILIVVHELGHFLMARLAGVGVERFSIGFGPVLWRFRGKETEYCVSAIPMGGYVKMMGDDENPLEGGKGMTIDPAKAFNGKPLAARFLIGQDGAKRARSQHSQDGDRALHDGYRNPRQDRRGGTLSPVRSLTCYSGIVSETGAGRELGGCRRP